MLLVSLLRAPSYKTLSREAEAHTLVYLPLSVRKHITIVIWF